MHSSNKLSAIYDDSLKPDIEATLTSLEKLLKQCALLGSLERIKRSNFALQRDSTIAMLENELRVLYEVITDELTRRTFMFIPTDKAKFYDSPRQRFPKTWGAFASARPDITEACKCYAAGRNTACVSHCLGILQRGLEALATTRDIGASFPVPVVLEQWQKIIDTIESHIRALGQLPKGSAKDAKLKFYSEAAVQFRYFKDAWRNHVAHAREEYDEHQALSILTHVRDFMEHLSKQLSDRRTPRGKTATPARA